MWVNTERLLRVGSVRLWVRLDVALWVVGALWVGGLWVGGLWVGILLVRILWVRILWVGGVLLLLLVRLVLESLLDH